MKYEEGSYGGHERWFVKVVHKGRKWVLGYENVDNKTPQMCGCYAYAVTVLSNAIRCCSMIRSLMS